MFLNQLPNTINYEELVLNRNHLKPLVKFSTMIPEKGDEKSCLVPAMCQMLSWAFYGHCLFESLQ